MYFWLILAHRWGVSRGKCLGHETVGEGIAVYQAVIALDLDGLLVLRLANSRSYESPLEVHSNLWTRDVTLLSSARLVFVSRGI